MKSNNTFNLFIEKTYKVSTKNIFNLFTNGTVFRLTGADFIESDYKTDGLFCLIFNERGTIYGRFLRITTNEIIIEWNVKGFDRPDENKTILKISLKHDTSGCLLSLNHTEIKNEEAASAKKHAWKEILNNLENEIEVN